MREGGQLLAGDGRKPRLDVRVLRERGGRCALPDPLETQNSAEVARRGTPAAPIEAPPPELPADLLQPNAAWKAVVRVHVARDGTAETVITTPTADPAVTRALDTALHRWRFRPTFIRGALPQDSTIELSVELSVS
jgi:outer membrane biosynthesis protein TonB